MTAGRDYRDYLSDMLEAMMKAREFVYGMSAREFAADDKTIFAVIRALEVVGEAARKVPAGIRESYPTLPWRGMTGMRDKLIHDYFGVNLEVVWITVTEELPPVEAALRAILSAPEA